MIVQNLKIFSQNVCKNSLITNTVLKSLSQFDIILIQEPPWSKIQKIPSSSNCEGEPLMGTCHHPNWIAFARLSLNSNDSPRVITYLSVFSFVKTFLTIVILTSFLSLIMTFVITFLTFTPTLLIRL